MNDIRYFLETHYTQLREYAIYTAYGDQDWGDELLHDMMERVLSGRVKLDLTASPLTYLQFVLRNCRRDGSRQALVIIETVPEDSQGVWPHSSPLLYVLDDWMTHLTGKQQTVIRLLLDGLTMAEIAGQLKVGESAAWNLYYRAVGELRKWAHTLPEGGPSSDRGCARGHQ